MRLRSLLSLLLLLGLLALGGWLWRDTAPLQRALPPAWRAALSGDGPPAGGARAATEGGVRKCRGAQGIVYTNEACPAGTRAEAVDGGTLSVLPAAARAAAASASAASAQSPLRRLAGPDESAAQRERVLEQALAR